MDEEIVRGEIPAYQQLAAILRAQIERGDFPPGTPIPSKRVLCQRYGVAPNTAEHAIQVLKAEGMLKTVIGLGLFPTDRSQWKR